MPIASRPATPALQDCVRAYHGFDEHTGAPTRRREGPGRDVVVILSFGNVWRIGDATDPLRHFSSYTSFVGGLRETAVMTEHDGASAGVQISLRPTGAYTLLGLPMHELANTVVPLEAILDASLVERVLARRTWEARFAELDAALAELAEGKRRASREVVWAWKRLVQTGGRARIAELCRELDWSQRRFVARFRDEVGLTPKVAARLIRFDRASELAGRDENPDWARLALECGYCDQSHLVNEFRRITGVSPAAQAA